MKNIILLISIAMLASCATQRTQIEIVKNQYCERQLLTINPFLASKSYFWIENADGSLDIKNKK